MHFSIHWKPYKKQGNLSEKFKRSNQNKCMDVPHLQCEYKMSLVRSRKSILRTKIKKYFIIKKAVLVCQVKWLRSDQDDIAGPPGSADGETNRERGRERGRERERERERKRT